MDKKQFFIGIFLAAIIGAVIALVGFQLITKKEQPYESFEQMQNVRFSNFLADTSFIVPEGINFVYAAEKATPGVVHIKSTITGNDEGYAYSNPFEEYFRDFFGEDSPRYRRGPMRSSGSGVIISANGYIVTNNHVVENSDEIEVVLDDNRTYSAELIGTDPTTDLALIKVNAEDLPFIKFGNSDNIRVGEWVLAVGNPFNLNSTVTAGIVSAKSRNINILRDQRGMQIEAFIQTDAAVNPGNSGGALVNLKGDLIGINTAIATPTGTYAGYSFAVPVSLVKKVMNDLKEFGVVQRALLGVNIRDVDAAFAEEKGFESLRGVYILNVAEGSAADNAGLQEGDIIIKIDDNNVYTVAELQEDIARNRPGDKVKITFIRNGKEEEVRATLKNAMGDFEIVKKRNSISIDGATFVDLDNEESAALNLQSGGVKVSEINSGKWQDAGIKEGFIITSIDKTPVSSINDLMQIIKNKQGGVLIEGLYPDGQRAFYGLGW